MRKINKSLALLLAILIMLSTPVYAAECDPIVPYASSVLRQYTATIHAISGNEIQVWFDVIGTNTLDRIGALKIEIQRSSDGESWTTVETYMCTDYADMMATNISFCDGHVTYYGEYGYYYRAKVTFLGEKGGTVYTPTIYTDMIYLAP